MKNFKKLSAIFLSMLLLLSAVFIPMTVQTVSAEGYKPTDSLIYGQTATYSKHSTGLTYASSDHATMKMTTDGNTSDKASFRDGAEGQNIVWMFNNYARVDAFELWTETDEAYDFGFELYVSSNSVDLFDAANLAYTHTRDEANTAAGHYSITLDTPVEGAIVGMLITDTNGDGTIYIREFALYGEKVAEQNATFYANRYVLMRNLANDGAESLIAGDLPFSATVGNTTTKATGTEYSATEGQVLFTALTDAKYERTTSYKTDISGATYGDANKGWYQFTYKFDSLTKVTGAAVYTGTIDDTRGFDWEIYIGNDPATLYDGDAVASGRSYKADGHEYGTRVLLSNTGNYVGTYVGFKLIPENTKNDRTVRLGELQVFGEGNQTGTIDRWATATDVTGNTNLIKDRTYELAYVDTGVAGDSFNMSEIAKTYPRAGNTKFSDGLVSTNHTDFSNATNGKFIWSLAETSDITSFVLYNHRSQKYLTSYEVYASDRLDTLFDVNNKVYEYKFERDPSTTYPLEQYCKVGGQYVEFYGDDVKSANYVAVWLRDGGIADSNNTGIRISEIGFYGKTSKNAKTNPKVYAQNLGEGTTYAEWATRLGNENITLDNNLLKAGSFSAKDASGNTVSISASNVEKLTNGTTNNEEFYGPYLNYELTYFLGAPTTIDTLFINRNNKNIWAGADYSDGYKVYLGYSQATLYNEENLILDLSDATATPRIVGLAAVYNNPTKKGLFLGIKVTDSTYTDGNVRIAEVAAFGVQDDMGYELAPSIGAMASADSAKTNADDVNLLRGLKATTGFYGSTHKTTGLYCIDGVTDGVANLHYDFNYTSYNEAKGSELFYDLGYVSTINEFAFWMTCENRQFSYEVYMGADYDTMFEAPVAVWDYNIVPDSLGQKFTFDEAKQARYIAIRLTDTRHGPNADSYRISEIAAFGTIGGEAADFVELNGAEITDDGKTLKYNATYYFPAGIMTETITDIGTVVYPTTALAGAELTLDTAGASKSSATVDDVMDIVNAYDTAGFKGIRANSTFSGADTVGATTKLTARAYVTLSNGTTYYSAPYSYSVTQIKRLAAKKYKSIFENDTDYITNKGYNGAIDTVWAELVASKNNVSADKSAALSGAAAWINNVKSTYGFEQEWLDNGVTTLGDSSRLSAVIRKLMRGENVTLVQLGGSITEGYFATDKHGQAELVADFLNAAFPGQVTVKNAGIAATGATFGAYRLEQDVLGFNPDLVIIEYAINDARHDIQGIAAYEDIIRRLLSEDIAVIALHNLQVYSSFIRAEGSATTHQNIGYFYDIPQVRLFNAYFDTTVYGQGDGMNYNTGDAVHPNDQGHNAAAAVVANLIYSVMADIENQPTVSAPIPTVPMTRLGGYIDDTATVYKSQDIEAGNTPIGISGAGFESNVANCGNADIRANHNYGIYTIPAGSTAIIAVSQAIDVLPLTAANANGSQAPTFVVTDAEGNVLNEGTFTSYYKDSLTTEKSRIIEGTRFYNGEAKDITISITAVDGPVYLAGVLACVAG